MKELSIPGFIPFILHKWHSHFIYQCNISVPPPLRSGMIQAVDSSIKTGIHAGMDLKWVQLEKETEVSLLSCVDVVLV